MRHYRYCSATGAAELEKNMSKRKGSGLTRWDLINRAADRIKRIDNAILAVNRDLEELGETYLIDSQLTAQARNDIKNLLLGKPLVG